MEQDKAKLLLKADAYIAFLVEQGKVFTYLPQGQTGIFGTVYQPRPAELYPGLQGQWIIAFFKTRRLLGAQTTWIDLPDYPDQLQHYMHDSSWLRTSSWTLASAQLLSWAGYMTFAWGLLGLPVMSPFQLYGLLPGLPTFFG